MVERKWSILCAKLASNYYGYLMVVVLFLGASCSSDSDSLTDDAELVNTVQKDVSVVSTSMDMINGQYIVELHSGAFGDIVSSNTFKSMSKSKRKEAYFTEINKIKENFGQSRKIDFGIEKSKMISVYAYAFEGFSVKLTNEEYDRLKNDPRVKNIYQDHVIALKRPDRPGGGGGGGGTAGQETPWGINRVGGAGNGVGKTAWVIDSGIDLDHPDLNVDVSRSVSYVTGDASPNDGNGHGTHVAGTIAAIDNNIGVVGVAAGASVVSLRVLGSDGTGDFSWTASALDYVAAVGSPGDVANMSLGPSSPYIHALTDSATQNLASTGVKIAIAAGNEYDDCALYTPAHNNHPNIYTVSALAEGDYFVYFSNYGTPVDYIAPGYQVKSTWLSGGYSTISGTSMASPHMAGILLLSNNPSSGGTATDAYWEVKGQSLTGRFGATNSYRRSVFRPDLDGIPEPIAVHN